MLKTSVNLLSRSINISVSTIGSSLTSISDELAYGWMSFSDELLDNGIDSFKANKQFINDSKTFIVSIPSHVKAVLVVSTQLGSSLTASAIDSLKSGGNSLTSISDRLAEGWISFADGILNNIKNSITGTKEFVNSVGSGAKFVSNSIADGITSLKLSVADGFSSQRIAISIWGSSIWNSTKKFVIDFISQPPKLIVKNPIIIPPSLTTTAPTTKVEVPAPVSATQRPATSATGSSVTTERIVYVSAPQRPAISAAGSTTIINQFDPTIFARIQGIELALQNSISHDSRQTDRTYDSVSRSISGASENITEDGILNDPTLNRPLINNAIITTSTFSGTTGVYTGDVSALSFNGNTFTTGTGILTIGAGKTLTVSDSTTLATNSITLAGGEVITFSPTNALSLLTTGTTLVTLPTTGTLISTDQTTGQTIGTTTNRLTKLWATDVTSTGFSGPLTGNVTGNADTATKLATTKTIGGVAFDGSANITVASATGGFAISGGALTLGTNDITGIGSIADTTNRVTKLWATNIESTNMPTVGGIAMLTISSADILTNKTIVAGNNTISGITNANLSGTAGITNANLANSTISGIYLGSNLAILTFGTHLTGTSYNGSTAVTIATDATDANTLSTIVARDASGNFSAGTITATTFSGALTGHASSDALVGQQFYIGTTQVAINRGTGALSLAGVSIDGSAGSVAVGGITGLGTGVATALAVNVGTAGSPLVNGGVLGTPSSGTVTNLTGTASININGTVGATTATTGKFTTLESTNIAALTTIAESWIGPSSTAGIYFKGGFVGIGTTGPGAKLEIAGDDTPIKGRTTAGSLKVRSTGYSEATIGTGFFEHDRYGDVSLGATRSSGDLGALRLYAGNSERVTILGGGNVGIGTTGPDTRLSVRGTEVTSGSASYQMSIISDTAYNSSPVAGIVFHTKYNTGAAQIASYAAITGAKENTTIDNAAGYLALHTNVAGGSMTERLRINSTGNVGIGTTNPGALLHILKPTTSSGTETFRPNAAGSETNILVSTGADHWAQVDETPSDDGVTYVASPNGDSQVWKRDLYLIPDHSTGSGVINKITVYIQCKDLGGGGGTAAWKASIKTHSTTYDSSVFTGGSLWQLFSNEWATNPYTGVAWTWNEIDALEIGVNILDFSYWSMQCTQVYAVIDYDTTNPPFMVYDESSDTTPFVIDNLGNVGIGTTGPGNLLEIYKIPATTTTLQPMLTLNSDYGSAIGTGFGSSIVFRGRTVGNITQDNAQISAYNENGDNNGYALGFFTAPSIGVMTQRMTITRTGNVSIGTLAGTGNRAVYSDASGTLTNVSSDINLKKNIDTISEKIDVLASLNQLRGVYYNWNTDVETAKNLGDQREIGMIAQEVELVLPELVGTNATGYKSLDYSKMTGFLIEVSKAQQVLIDEMNLKVEGINNMDIENDWRDNITAWLANGANKITRIFTGEICLTDPGQEAECINRSELKSLKALLLGSVDTGGNSGGSGDETPTCIAPQTLVGGVCTTPALTCILPEILTDGACIIPTPETPTCSDGIKNQDETGVDTGGVCTQTPPADPTCTAPQTLVNHVCMDPVVPPTCTDSQILVNNVCVNSPLTCTAPQVPVNGICADPS